MLGGAVHPLRPQRKFFCARGEYITMSNGLFNFNFLALLLSEISGGSQICTRGPYVPWTPPRGEIFVPKASTLQYLFAFLISTFELQQFPRFQGGPKFTLGGPMPPGRPHRRNFLPLCESFTMSNCVFNFNILTLVVSEILVGPKFTLGGPVPPIRPLAEIFLYPRRVRYYV